MSNISANMSNIIIIILLTNNISINQKRYKLRSLPYIRFPLLKQKSKLEFKANLAALWAAELPFLQTQQNLTETKREEKQRILLMVVLECQSEIS